MTAGQHHQSDGFRVGDRWVDTTQPLLMGVVNATPDSFSDAGEHQTVADRVALALRLREAGASIIDIGGQSGITGVPEISADEEIERVVPVIEQVAAAGVDLISIDTYKPAVAEAALAAGAAIVNDVSGLRYPDVIAACVRHRAAYVLMHNLGKPKIRLTRTDLYDDVVTDVHDWLAEKTLVALEQGLPDDALILDTGIDFAKTPAQTVAMLRRFDELLTLRRPWLHAISRKDFLGVATGRPPRERDAATLGVLGHLAPHGGIYRVHDVAAAADFLIVRGVLNGDRELDPTARLEADLRRTEASNAANPVVDEG